VALWYENSPARKHNPRPAGSSRWTHRWFV
jgi:hypothetical protein